MVSGFVFVGAEVSQGAVGADGVVEGFDVVEDGEAGLVSCLEDVAVDQLGFDGADGGFHEGVVPRVADAAHAEIPCA
jgi:hypothetical protein